MTDFSPAALAVLTAATQRLYCLDPEDVPTSASEHGCAIAAALRAVADQVAPEDFAYDSGSLADGALEFEQGQDCRNEAIRWNLLAIAAELEGVNG